MNVTFCGMRPWFKLGCIGMTVALVTACGGSEQPAGTAAGGLASGSRPAVQEVDVCALLSPDEIGEVIGQPAAAAQRQEPFPPLFSCRYEDDAITPMVHVTVADWSDAASALASFNIGVDQYPAIAGVGDRAYNAQPFNDVVAVSGRYEISVDVAFLSTDKEVELNAAVRIAQIAIGRLP